MTLDALVQLIAENKYDEWLDALENEPPRVVLDSIHAAAEKGIDTLSFTEILQEDKERYKRLCWLVSTEREREYFMAIPDEEMTDQDWFDFRATDF